MEIARPFNVNVYGVTESVVASGYPMQVRVDKFDADVDTTYSGVERMKKLGHTDIGTGHDNALLGIVVQFDVCFPVKVWTEFQRYHFADTVSSQSTMHRLAKMDLSVAFDPSVDDRVIAIVQELQDAYNEHPTKENYLRLLMTCPTGLLLTARITTNYRQLKTIYAQRRNHRLPHWHVFCDWLETLPYAKEFGVVQ